MESSTVYQNMTRTATGINLAMNARDARRAGHGALCAGCARYYGPLEVCDMRTEETHGKPIKCTKYLPEQ